MKRRDEDVGLGGEHQTIQDKFKWNEKTWEDAYNSTINKMGVIKAERREVESSSDESEESTSEFDGEIVFEKCKTRLLVPRKEKEAEVKTVEKSEKSKKIKKDKKQDKKDKKEKKEKKEKKKKSKK